MLTLHLIITTINQEITHPAVYLIESILNAAFIFQHNFKKLRNSILKRPLVHQGRMILFSHWRSAYEWDKETNSMRVYHKLSHDHMYPDRALKMRNSLANEVLNKDMLHLMEVFFFHYFFYKSALGMIN